MTDQQMQGLGFLKGGGVMGTLTRTKDWSQTPLGAPQTWPQSLKTAVSILLNSRFPMFVWWGPQLLTFYNDAYMVIAGEKHPQALGAPGPVVWAEIWDVVGPMADQVMQEGIPTWADDQLLYLNRFGYVEETYFTFSYSPVFDEAGTVKGVFCACTETTEKVLTARNLQVSENRFRNLVIQAPVAICVVKEKDFVIELVNDRMLDFLGRTGDIIGKPIIEALPEARVQGLMDILNQVRKTGAPYYVSTFPATILINGVREERFFDLVFKPYFDDTQAEMSNIFVVAHNVTEQVASRRRLEESEKLLQQRVEARTADLQKQQAFISSILDASFSGIYALRSIRNENNEVVDFEYLFANNNTAQIMGYSPEQLIGCSMLQLIPDNKENGFFEMFCQVLQTGKPIQDATHFVTQNISNWFDYVIVPIDRETLVVTIQDITAQKNATLQIEQQRNLLDNIMKHSPSGITVTRLLRNSSGEDFTDARVIMANAISESYMGFQLELLLNNNISIIDPAFFKSSLFEESKQTLKTGEPSIMQYLIEPTGKWLEVAVAKMDDEHIVNVFTDITTSKKAELEIRESAERLAAVFNAAQSGMFIFEPVYKQQQIVDFKFVITNSNFASYVGQTPKVLQGELGSTWFPGYLHNGVFDMYKHTFLTGNTQRKNVHYNVDGHDIHLDLMSTKVGDELLVTFTDYTQLKTAQLQLERHIEELKRSNAILEEFAHAASHDLKEPVRKVQVFSDRLRRSLPTLSSEQEFLFARVEDATSRMSLLIEDLLDYSHVSMGVDLVEKIDLNEKLQIVIGDLEIAIQDKGATVEVAHLPVVSGHRRQLQQLFHNLIQNALKYSRQNVAPHITITAQKVVGYQTNFNLPPERSGLQYHLVQVRDNGIGFEQEYAEQIFKMFQRLHGKSEYSGSGVGLAIVRKVVDNHNGFIMAEGKPGEGATFKILFPAE